VTTVSVEAERLPDHVVYGPGTVARLPDLIAEAGARRVLLVCGRRSFEASGAVAALPGLREMASVTRWDDFSPNTDADDLRRGLEVLREVEADLVLGVGGGSAMDMAKLLCAYQGTDGQGVHDAIRAGATIEHRDAGLVLVPTTSGSGSEATHFAVVYIGHDKHSVAGPAMLPDRVVLDPELARSGSAYQRATSGIDAVCQAIESRWATGATDESREYARRALALCLEHLETFVAEATPASATGMGIGSHLAGRAINISKTTAAHALSYGITKRHGVSHGHAVALTLGPFIEAHATAERDVLQPQVDADEHARAMEEIVGALGADDGASARAVFIRLLEAIGLEPRASRLSIVDDEERRALAATVNLERLGNNPVAFAEGGLVRLLEQAE
jgi:alcohol dehydrogenase